MTITIKHEGVLRPVTGIKVMLGGTLRTIKQVKVMESDTLRTVASFATPLSLSISPNPVTGDGFSGVPTVVTSGSATATPAGGLGPYSYSWVMLTGTGFSIGNPTNASTSFSATVNSPGIKNGSARCTCTDLFGTTATADVSITLTNIEAA